MMRTDINLAIVAMVEEPTQPEMANATDEYCFASDVVIEDGPTRVVVSYIFRKIH